MGLNGIKGSWSLPVEEIGIEGRELDTGCHEHVRFKAGENFLGKYPAQVVVSVFGKNRPDVDIDEIYLP